MDMDVGQWETLSNRKFVTTCCFSPDSKSIIIGCSNGRIIMMDLASSKVIRKIRGFRLSVVSLSYSLYGKKIISGSAHKRHDFLPSGEQGNINGVISIWDAANCQLVLRIHQKDFSCACDLGYDTNRVKRMKDLLNAH